MKKILNFTDHAVFSKDWNAFELSRQNSRTWNVVGVEQDRIKDARVLELGSNEGRMSFAALQYGAASVTGVDCYEANIKTCRAKCPEATFIQSDIRDFVETTDDQFDVIICAGVLYHLEEHTRIFEGIGRLVKRGAHTVILETAVRQEDASENAKKNTLGHTMIWPRESDVIRGAGDNGFAVRRRQWDTSVFPLCTERYDEHRRIYTWHA
jgi:2-polyprenyl-3-methyl-5-hydroxy-6-metoxy-1,4-benzoquinol methylase